MAVERYISSDSHVLEPAHLWVEQMDKTFRDQAPRVVHNPPGYEGDYWLFGDRKPVTAVQGFFAGASRKSYDEITDHLDQARYESACQAPMILRRGSRTWNWTAPLPRCCIPPIPWV